MLIYARVLLLLRLEFYEYQGWKCHRHISGSLSVVPRNSLVSRTSFPALTCPPPDPLGNNLREINLDPEPYMQASLCPIAFYSVCLCVCARAHTFHSCRRMLSRAATAPLHITTTALPHRSQSPRNQNVTLPRKFWPHHLH